MQIKHFLMAAVVASMAGCAGNAPVRVALQDSHEPAAQRVASPCAQPQPPSGLACDGYRVNP